MYELLVSLGYDMYCVVGSRYVYEIDFWVLLLFVIFGKICETAKDHSSS